MYKYLTFKSTSTNKFWGLYACRILTDNPRSPRWLAHRNRPRLSSPDPGGCLQAVYLSLCGMEPKLINCSWLHADSAQVSSLWSCHSYGGQVPCWDRQAALKRASPWVAQPGRRWQTPGASLSYVCTALLLFPPQPSSPTPSHTESRLCVHPHLH